MLKLCELCGHYLEHNNYEFVWLGVRPICQHNFGNNRMLYKRMKNNAGIIGQQIEVMQHYIKPSFAKNTQYATKFIINSEVKRT